MLWEGAGGWSGLGAFVVLWVNHQAAAHAFALAFGVEIGFVA